MRYFDNEIQKNVQGMKHVIKGRKVDVKFPKKVCKLWTCEELSP